MTTTRFPDAPPQIAALKVEARGYPVPWFVPYIEGLPEFRAIDPRSPAYAHKHRLCWVCGRKLAGVLAFVLGPMCTVTRTNPEPPCHLDCARFAATACPFLTRPLAKRRDASDIKGGHQPPPGLMIARNPGCCGVWLTRSYRTERQPEGGLLFRIGPPLRVEWYAEGRTATRAEVMESIRTGLPLLEEQAAKDGPEALALLAVMADRARKLVPA
jgi:hypothetical protein